MRRSQRGSPSSLSTVDDDLPSDGGSDSGSQPSPGLTPGTRGLKSLLRQSSMRRSIGKKSESLHKPEVWEVGICKPEEWGFLCNRGFIGVLEILIGAQGEQPA